MDVSKERFIESLSLNKDNNIRHLAIILDGNKRWAKEKNISLDKVYKKGFENIENITNVCIEKNISHLTLFTTGSG